MIPEFVDFLDIAVKALEKEDLFLRNTISANPSAYPPSNPLNRCGLLRFNNERYYQFAIARGLFKAYPYIVEVEDGDKLFDLTLATQDKNVPFFGVVEMKRWMSIKGGGLELQRIGEDINKLRNANTQKKITENALMLIFSADIRDTAKIEENLEWLSGHLKPENTQWEYRFFPTFNNQGTPVYFWIAGYEVF
jgi:hypothetical protein